jgi:hypothetical protein
MLQAVEAPVLKLVAVAGAALAVAWAAPSSRHDHGIVQQLELHAEKIPTAVYLTAWDRGDVRITLPDRRPHAMTFKTRAHVYGCDWLATEQLVPDGENRYWYSYDEEKLACDDDAPPTITTPRVGYVIVVGR